MKYCVDCKYYVWIKDFRGGYYGCSSPKRESNVRNIVTGEHYFYSDKCEILRDEFVITCGKKGKWFEKKEEPKPGQLIEIKPPDKKQSWLSWLCGFLFNVQE